MTYTKLGDINNKNNQRFDSVNIDYSLRTQENLCWSDQKLSKEQKTKLFDKD